MTVSLTIIDIDDSTTGWKLLHSPNWEVPFRTLSGTQHVWNWDFTTGNLLQDGEPLIGNGYSITIEPVYEEAA